MYSQFMMHGQRNIKLFLLYICKGLEPTGVHTFHSFPTCHTFQ